MSAPRKPVPRLAPPPGGKKCPARPGAPLERWTFRNAAFCLGLCGMLPGVNACAAAQGRFTLSSGVDYSTGNYGETTATRVLYLPFTGKYENRDWMFKLTVPRVEINGPGMVAVGDMQSGSPATRGRAGGLGDVVATVARTFWQSPDQRWLVDLGGKVKLGTASAEQGLGTGENDYALYIESYRTWRQLTLLGTLGYRVMGDTADIDFTHVWHGSVGASWRLDARQSLGAMFDWRQASSASSGEQREYTLFHAWHLNDTYRLQTYLVKGQATASPDWGGGLALSVSW